MKLNDAEADYLVELFKVGLEEVAERVAVITDQPVTISTPKVFDGQEVADIARDLDINADMTGSMATLPLTDGFEGTGLLFLQAGQDKAFADLLSAHCDDQQSRDTALSELAKVLLEQYVVVMTDLLNLNIGHGEMRFAHECFQAHPQLISGTQDGSLCLSMSFVLYDLNIHCHIVFIHNPPGNELLSVVKSALTNMGLAE